MSSVSAATPSTPISKAAFDGFAPFPSTSSESGSTSDSSASTDTSTTTRAQPSRKRARPTAEFDHVHQSMDQMERELEMIKIKLLTCRSAAQKAMINLQVDRILAKCQEIKEEVVEKKKKVT